jgi:sporulation protein YlmC with PRC-barrel domain
MNEYPNSPLIGSDVFTSNDKKIGKIIAIDETENTKYLKVLNKGILRDEEYRIPFNSIAKIVDESKIYLTLTEDETKHGYEFLDTDHPSSDLVSGKSNSTLSTPFQKEKIKYESFYDNPENSNNMNSKIKENEFLCDRCTSKFESSLELETHKKNNH